jgi:integrase
VACRPPDTATADDLRLFQARQQEDGVPVPTMNSIVAALRFFFTHTLDRPDLARKLVRLSHPRKLPVVLSRVEVARLLNATTCLNMLARRRHLPTPRSVLRSPSRLKISSWLSLPAPMRPSDLIANFPSTPFAKAPLAMAPIADAR